MDHIATYKFIRSQAALVQARLEFGYHRVQANQVELEFKNFNSLTRESNRLYIYIYYFNSKITYIFLLFYYLLRKIIILFNF